MTDKETYFKQGREHYRATNSLVWPSRHRERPSLKPDDQQHTAPLIDTRYVRLLLERLDEYEKKTRPSKGSASAGRKDLAAFQALKTAGRLVWYVAGWAIDHQIGLAFEGRGVVPLGTPQAKSHPDYAREIAAADDHEHERRGGHIIELDGPSQRRALINLLLANSGGFPAMVQQPASEALEALNFAEVLPLVEPAKGKRKVKLVELRLQLQVVGFVEFKIATGIKKHLALQTASEALNGVAESTISGWEYRLRQELGQLTVVRTLTRYANWGRMYKINKERQAAGEPDADPDTYDQLGGLTALQCVAKRYWELKKSKKTKKSSS